MRMLLLLSLSFPFSHTHTHTRALSLFLTWEDPNRTTQQMNAKPLTLPAARARVPSRIFSLGTKPRYLNTLIQVKKALLWRWEG